MLGVALTNADWIAGGNRTTAMQQHYPVLVVAAGVTSYIIFKRTETISNRSLSVLLLAVPSLLAYLPPDKDASVVTSFVGYYAVIFLCTILYRLSPWHPLARYPGPWICKLTKFRVALEGGKGRLYLYTRDLHEKYGDVVRIGPNELSFRNADAINPIFGKNGIAKGPFWDGRLPETLKVYPIVAIRDLKDHHHRRTTWSKGFSSNALKEYEVLVKAKTELLVGRLLEVGQNGKQVVDINQWMSYYTYDLMTDFVFSGGSNMLEHGDPDGLWDAIRGGQKNTMFFSQVPWLGRMLYRLPDCIYGGSMAFRKNSYARAMKRKAEGAKGRKDLYYYLLDEGNPDAKPNGPQVISDASSAVLGGSDTTSTTVTLLVYYLLTRPKVYERLRKEVDSVGERWEDTAVQAKMEYLNGVINETLRMWPVVPSGSPRGVKPEEEGRMVGESYIPPGTNVNIPSYSVHRDPRNFSPHPDEFIPERWLDEDARANLEPDVAWREYKHNHGAFLAFSAGPANCVGKNLALMEMRMVLCAFMKRLEWDLVDGSGLEDTPLFHPSNDCIAALQEKQRSVFTHTLLRDRLRGSQVPGSEHLIRVVFEITYKQRGSTEELPQNLPRLSTRTNLKMITLYDLGPSHFPADLGCSPHVRKIVFTLNYKKIPFTIKTLLFDAIEPTAKSLGADPTGKKADGSPKYTVPIIEDHTKGKVVSDSLRIAEYLDQAYPDTPVVVPPGTQELQSKLMDEVTERTGVMQRFQMMKWVKFCTPELLESRKKAHGDQQLPPGFLEFTPEEEAAAWVKAKESFEELDKKFYEGKGLFLMGDKPVFADLAIAAWMVTGKVINGGEESKEWKETAGWINGRVGKLTEEALKYKRVEA
ncbi:hypothetical protein V5O48_002435 [Marasmius crinis-equi]|uniref:GST N-terminal domain-containing protein n=1 Tax=Marasmius crinis-equi TaxID=585013 RepID=A0ABR3FW36_9AGAR